jgi:hypothetical protein
VYREHIESYEGGGRLSRKLLYARRGWMQAQLQRIEVEAARRRDYDLAVKHTVLGQFLEQHLVELRKIAIQRP